jgi:hypothetical protein
MPEARAALELDPLRGAGARLRVFVCGRLEGIRDTALHKGRGYFMVVAPQGSISSNRPAFEAARRSFRFIHY